MRDLLLSTFLTIGSLPVIGQVVVQVLTPASIAGGFDNAFAVNAGSNSWAMPDLTLPANAVQGAAQVVSDGTAADSLGCNALTNASEVTGKIAIVYRGTCSFGEKALNAQNAGAIAVVFISNGEDLNINMLGGAEGLQVTIPVVMIAASSGALIRPELDAGTVTMFIGNNFGAFPFNLSFDEQDVLVPGVASLPGLVAADASEFNVLLGGWIHNNGSAEQTTARMNVKVVQDGNTLYDETSDPATIPSGDSLFVDLGTFDQPTYSGRYAVVYTVLSDEADAYPADDTRELSLAIGDVFSYAPTDAASGIPIDNTHVVPAALTGTFTNCIQFTNANASRIAATGLYFSARTQADEVAPFDSVLTGMIALANAYLWTDDIAGPFTTPTVDGLALLSSKEYSFPSDLQDQPIFIPFDEAVELDDNARYLFCIQTFDALLRQGWNSTLDYQQNFQTIGEPVSLFQNGDTWFNGFTALSGVPSIGVQTIDANTIGMAEHDKVDITPFPNPTARLLNIPMQGLGGAAVLRIFDLSGAKVAEQRVNVGDRMLAVDVSTVANGTYLFQMDFENGQRSEFRVVVAK
ncbi:MAG: PA domain-containing protein [Flavobacteriales bacterium]